MAAVRRRQVGRTAWWRAAFVAALLVIAAGAAVAHGPLSGTASAAATTGASAGCGKAPALTDGNGSMKVGGDDRTYILRLPKNYDRDHPYRLIFAFHWFGGTSRDIDEAGTSGYPWSYYGLRALSNDSAIFVAPQGIGNGWANSGGRDLKFVDEMISTFETGLCVDTSQLFSAGFSYGGGMTYELACSRPTVFRAVAVYSGSQLSGCDGGKEPVAYIGIHGTRDAILSISNGRTLRDTFVRNNGCTPQNPPEPAAGTLTHIVTYYSGCKAGYPVAWAPFDGGHAPNAVDGTDDLFAPGEKSWTRPVVWDFFTQFKSTIPTSPTPSTSPSSTSPTSTPPTSAPPSTIPPTTGGPSGNCTVSYRMVNSWSSGFQGEVTVTNTGTSATTGWTVQMTLAGGQSIGNLWNGVNTGATGPVTVTNASYNGALAPAASATFGFLVAGNNNAAPSNLRCART